MAGGSGREIERVWLLRTVPEIPAGARVERWEIEQGYLAPLAESEAELAQLGFPEGRLRRIVTPSGDERFVHTVKRGSGIVREETEREITRAEFERSWPRTEGRRLSKVRLRVREAGFVWELDRFHDLVRNGAPLAMLEVELSDASQEVALPAWLAPHVEREISNDARYRNAALATHGVPADHA
jgi:CYTH domain-containing protein